MSCLRFCISCVFATTFLVSSIVHAGPVERMADIALHPSNPDVVVVHYLNGGTGLLYSSDAGRSFRLLCALAIHKDKPSGPMAIADDGHVLVGIFRGLWEDSGAGCGWSLAPPLEGRWITDVQVDPASAAILAITGNGGDGAMNGVVRREGPGRWTDLGVREPVGLTRLRVTKTPAGLRLYTSALRVIPVDDAGMIGTKYFTRFSDDDGKTWEEHEFTAGGTEPFRLEAVDPTNPDRVIGSVQRAGSPDSLFLSRDKGATFTPYLEVADLGAIIFAPDGRLWVGEPQSVTSTTASRGLWFAPNLDSPITKVADFGVECLAYQPATQTLYACQAYSFGTVNTTSWTFNETFNFRTAKEFVQCEGIDMPATCSVQLCIEYCAAGHFAQAPLCCVYTSDSCGPIIAEMEGTGSRAMCIANGVDGGVSAGGGTGGVVQGAGAGAGMGGGSLAAPNGVGGAAGVSPMPPGGGSGGCSCRTVDGGRSRRAGAIFLLLAGVAALRSRRSSQLHERVERR